MPLDRSERRCDHEPSASGAGDSDPHTIFVDIGAGLHLDARHGGVKELARVGYGKSHGDGFGTATGGKYLLLEEGDGELVTITHFLLTLFFNTKSLFQLTAQN